MGVNSGIEHERRFLVRPEFVPPADQWPVSFEHSFIEQVYLQTPDGDNVRIRRRFWPESRKTEYDWTEKVPLDNVRSQETIRLIQPGEFLLLNAMQDPRTRTIYKWRRVFHWDGVLFELDLFVAPARVVILEVEIQEFPDREINLPEFLGRLSEVTGNKAWSNRAMSMHSWAHPGF